MSRTFCRRTVAGILTVLSMYLGVWLNSPIGPVPGTPLRMLGADGTDLKVGALTFSEGPDRRWRHVGDSTVKMIPLRWLHELKTFQMGTGQDLAQDAGIDAAKYVLGASNLKRPVGVYPGIVNGTSSGLAWALATLLLNDPTLRNDEVVYATGALYGADGVSSINGLETKLSTGGLREARAVFVPASQYHEALSILNGRGERDIARRVFGVAHVSEALAVLCKSTPQSESCSSAR